MLKKLMPVAELSRFVTLSSKTAYLKSWTLFSEFSTRNTQVALGISFPIFLCVCKFCYTRFLMALLVMTNYDVFS